VRISLNVTTIEGKHRESQIERSRNN